MSDYSLLHRAHEALKVEHERLKAELAELYRNGVVANVVGTASMPTKAIVYAVPHRNDHDA